MVLLALAHTKGKFEPDAKELSRGVRGSARAHWVYPLARRLCTARRTVDPEQVQGTFDNPSAPSVLASRTRARELAPTTGTNIPTIPAPEIMVGTNFGYSNGVYFQNVVTQIVLPQRPPDYEAGQRHLQEWKERNALLGIDQDIAKREAELKERAKLLAIGMTRNR